MFSPALPLLPQLYHAHNSLYLDDIPFWLKLAERYGSPILELGCGTGRVLLPLTKAGYRLYGVDNDPDMLMFLHSQIPAGLEPAPTIIQADMTRLVDRLSEIAGFALVISPCNTLSLLSPAERKATLASAYCLLRPGGCLALSLPNPEELVRLPQASPPEIEEVFPHPVSGLPVQVSSSWRRTSMSFIVRWDYDQLLPDGQVEHASVKLSHSLAPAQTYLAELTSTGFTGIETYGDFDESPYEPDSPELILVAFR
ncbi:MAG: class I SAM-dependent methyltransferase [Anaerolineales bacterium]|nr:class I SAM-dependent methyltransferase [Anaerolineales bacterium]